MRPSKSQTIKIGDVFGKWKTLSISYLIKDVKKNRNTSYVDCVCECGKTKAIKANNLINGTSSGCGRCGNRYKRTDEQLCLTSINNILVDYRSSAKTRGYSFELSLKDAKDMFFANCHYCGSPPSNVKKNKHTVVLYNGIDRLDNAVGYQIDNCVPCCSECNIMKLDHSGSKFIEHIKKILTYNQYSDYISEKKLITFHERAMVIASQSHDSQTKVAALLLDSKTLAVLAEGFNGFIRGGKDHILPSTRPEKYNYIIHAETNLLCNAVRSGIKMDGGIIYCTLSPCVKCIRMLWQAGVNVIYFKDKYSDFDESCSMLDLNVKTEIIGKFYKLSLSPKV